MSRYGWWARSRAHSSTRQAPVAHRLGWITRGAVERARIAFYPETRQFRWLVPGQGWSDLVEELGFCLWCNVVMAEIRFDDGRPLG